MSGPTLLMDGKFFVFHSHLSDILSVMTVANKKIMFACTLGHENPIIFEFMFYHALSVSCLGDGGNAALNAIMFNYQMAVQFINQHDPSTRS